MSVPGPARTSTRATLHVNGVAIGEVTNVTVTSGEPVCACVPPTLRDVLRESARTRGVNPARLHFYETHILFDDHPVPDSEYDAAARHDALRPAAPAQQDDRGYLDAPLRPALAAPTLPACFAPFEDGPRRGKSGKNKATRRFDLPPRRL